jgi:hypothetical protein
MKGDIELMIEQLEPLRLEMGDSGRFDEAMLLRDIKWTLEKAAERKTALEAVVKVCHNMRSPDDPNFILKLAECIREIVVPALRNPERP